MKKLESKKVLVEVNGFNIMSDTLYEVTGKHDSSAPQAFQDANIAKAPFPENATHICCPWDNFSGAYDTGFYARSRCYNGLDKDEVNRLVKQRVDNIMKPFEDITQKDLRQTNFEFWDDAKDKIFMGKVFNTSNVNELFYLYLAIFSGMLTPQELDGDPMFMNSMFCLVEKDNAKDFVQQREINKMNISYKFINALKKGGEDRQSVIDLLLYIGIVTRPDFTEDDYYLGSLSNWMNEKKTNVDYLLDIWDRSLESDFHEVLEFYRIINVLQRNGRVTMSPNGIQYNGQTLGPDVRTSAEFVASKKDMVSVKASMLDEYEEMMSMDNINEKAKIRKPKDVKKASDDDSSDPSANEAIGEDKR